MSDSKYLLCTVLISLALAGCGGGDGLSTAESTDPGGGTPSPPPPPPAGGGGGGPAATKPTVYIADQFAYEIYELFMADPANPGSSIRLNGALVPGGVVDDYALSNDGTFVAYSGDEDTLNRSELYMVTIANPGNSIRLNTPLTVNRDVIDFAISPDGTKVVYRADQDSADVWELYLVNVANPAVSTKLSAPLVPGAWVRTGFSFSPDGTRVVYRADADQVDTLELFVVDVATPGIAKQVNPALTAGGNVYTAFGFSPDSARIAYIADQDADEVLELYAVNVAAPGTSSKLNGTLVPNGDVCQFTFSPDSTRVAYCADQEQDGRMELFTATFSAAGQSVKLNPPLVTDGAVTPGYEFGPDSSYLVYAAKQEVSTRVDLFRVDVALPGIAQKVNASLTSGGNVVSFRIRPDGEQLSYVANQENVDKYELYAANFATPGAVTKLSAPQGAGGLFTFEYSADGTQVTYLADQDTEESELYRVDVASPGLSTQLNGTLVTGGEVWDFTLAK
jgi:Tol biopolymer transport system component